MAHGLLRRGDRHRLPINQNAPFGGRRNAKQRQRNIGAPRPHKARKAQNLSG